MKRTAVSNTTPEQAADELIMIEVKKLLQKAKKAYEKAQEKEAAVFRMLEDDMCLDMEAPSEAENANNLGEAITCWLSYDEYSLAGLIKEIRAQYIKEDRSWIN